MEKNWAEIYLKLMIPFYVYIGITQIQDSGNEQVHSIVVALKK